MAIPKPDLRWDTRHLSSTARTYWERVLSNMWGFLPKAVREDPPNLNVSFTPLWGRMGKKFKHPAEFGPRADGRVMAIAINQSMMARGEDAGIEDLKRLIVLAFYAWEEAYEPRPRGWGRRMSGWHIGERRGHDSMVEVIPPWDDDVLALQMRLGAEELINKPPRLMRWEHHQTYPSGRRSKKKSRANPHPPEHMPPGWTSDPSAPSATSIQGDSRVGNVHIFLPPTDFLRLVPPMDKVGRKAPWTELWQDVAPSWLEVRSGKGNKDVRIVGHEGRHRAEYAMRTRVAWLPVTLVLWDEEGNKYVDLDTMEKERGWGWDTADYREDPVWAAVAAGKGFFLRGQRGSNPYGGDRDPGRLMRLAPDNSRGAPPQAYTIAGIY